MNARRPGLPTCVALGISLVFAACSNGNQVGDTRGDSPAADVSRGDSSATDTRAGDSGQSDSRTTDTGSLDTSATDAGELDIAVAPDTGAGDSGEPTDSGAMDSGGAVDSLTTDTGGVRDTGTLDTGVPTDGSAGADVLRDTRPTDGPVCTGTHPLLDSGARFCAPSDCYCPNPGTGGDTCFPRATAASCCVGRTVVCSGMDDAGFCAAGTHPLLDAGAPFCAPGQCYCASQDNCRPVATATACCGAAVVCN